METIYKSWEQGTEVWENRGVGAAAAIGNMDRGGDCIFPGAFRDCLAGFVRSGCVLAGHAWGMAEIAMPMSAEERGGRLICTWEYHDTPAAQEHRRVAQKRLEAGKTVGLSVGFKIAEDGWAEFPNGEALWRHIVESGLDPALFDEASIRSWKGWCRAITKVGELFEFSQVNVPMNPQAVAASVKTFFGEGGPHAGLPLADHLDAVLAAAEGACARLHGYQSVRQKDGRPMSPERIAQARRLADALRSLDPGEDQRGSLAALKERSLNLRSRLLAH